MISAVFNNKYGDAYAFVRAMDYIVSAGNEEKTLSTGSINMSCNKLGGLKYEMMSLAGLNVRCKNPLHHAVLSWAEGEVPSRDQCIEAARIYMEEMGLAYCMCLWGVHQNTENIHMHLCINRTDLLTFKTITPANGWTRKTCEKVCRLIEARQGWRSSPGKFWTIGSKGYVVKKEGRPELLRSVPHGTGSFEHRYGIKSAITIAQDDAAEALYGAGSWAELHEGLLKKNMQLEQQERGLILHVGNDHVVKVSSVSHEVSMKNLEKRLGPYEPPLKTAELAPMRIARVDSPVVPLRHYIPLKLEYDAKKSEAFEDLKAKQGAELRKMKAEHKEAFKELYGVSWKGRKEELLDKQKCLYGSQRKEREKLREDHIIERMYLRREYPAFPEYTEWLKKNGRESIVSLWAYRNSNVGALFNDSSASDPVPRPMPVYGFEGRSFCEEGYWYVYYVKADGRAAFRDNGDSIEVFEKNWESTSAALYLASLKWQRIGPVGPDWFMSIVAEIGASHDYSFSDEALVKRISLIRTRAKAQEAEARKTGLAQIDAFDRFHREVGAERYLVHVQRSASAPKTSDRMYFLGESLSGSIVGFTPSRLVGDLPRLVGLLDEGKVFLTISPQSDRYLYFSLIVPDICKKTDFISRYPPLCAVKSSSSLGMLVYRVPRVHGFFPVEACNRLVRKLCGELSSGCAGGIGLTTYAPFFSASSGKSEPFVMLYEYGHLDLNSELNQKYRDECKLAKEEGIRRISKKMESVAPDRAADNVFEAFRLHAADILREESSPNYSVIDRRIALRLIVTGYSYDEILSAVEVCAPRAYPVERPEVIGWHDYAVRVVNSTKTTEGRMERSIQFPLKELYLRIEGRWTAEMEAAKVYDNEAWGIYQGEVFSHVKNGSFLLKLESNGRLIRQYVTDSYLWIGDRVRISYGGDVTQAGTVEKLPVRTVTPVTEPETSRLTEPAVSVRQAPAEEVCEASLSSAVRTAEASAVTPVATHAPEARLSSEPVVTTHQAKVSDIREVSKPLAAKTSEKAAVRASAERQLPEEADSDPERPGTEPDYWEVALEDPELSRRKPVIVRQDSGNTGIAHCTQEQKISSKHTEDVPVLFNVHSDDPKNPYDRLYVEYIDRDRDLFGAADDHGRQSVHSMAGYRAKDTLAVGNCVSVKYPGNVISGAGDIFDRTIYFGYSYAGMAAFVGTGVDRHKAEPGREYHGMTLRLDDKTVGICFVNALGKNEIVEVSRESLANSLGRDVRRLGDKESVQILTGYPDARVVWASSVNDRGQWIGY